uniref:Uncharacterized protein n=1 Tax=Plectus sambesii TaxID=2011161 RepID=A0A914WDU4_9BILA
MPSPHFANGKGNELEREKTAKKKTKACNSLCVSDGCRVPRGGETAEWRDRIRYDVTNACVVRPNTPSSLWLRAVFEWIHSISTFIVVIS